MTINRETKVSTDAHGITQNRAETVSLDLATAAEDDLEAFNAFLRDDDAADKERVQQILDGAEKSVVQFWVSQRLPPEPAGTGLRRHPSQQAAAGSFLHSSWRIWRHLEEARVALAAGQLQRTFWLAYVLGRIMGEVDVAMRHGLDAKLGGSMRAKNRQVAKKHHELNAAMHEDWRQRLELMLPDKLTVYRMAKVIHQHWPNQEFGTIKQFVLRELQEKKKQLEMTWIGTSSHVPKN
jgi:hypothetical protein